MSTKHTGGRPPKLDPVSIRLSIRFNSEEHAKFLSLYERSGVYCNTSFEIPIQRISFTMPIISITGQYLYIRIKISLNC